MPQIIELKQSNTRFLVAVDKILYVEEINKKGCYIYFDKDHFFRVECSFEDIRERMAPSARQLLRTSVNEPSDSPMVA